MKLKQIAALLVACGLFAAPAWAKNDKPQHWQKAVQKANERIHRRAACSVLGDNVSLSVRRNSVQAAEERKLEKIFKAKPDEKTKFMTVYKAMKGNELFKSYKLTVSGGADLVYDNSENVYIQRFFTGTLKAREARKYKEVILVLLVTPTYEPFWFMIDPQNQLVTLIYNDEHTLRGIPELQTAYTQLSI